MPTVRITIGGKVALTVAQAAERHGVSSIDTMHSIIRRAALEPDGHIDGRTPLYLAEKVRQAMVNRPGKGNRLSRRTAWATSSSRSRSSSMVVSATTTCAGLDVPAGS